MNSEGGATPIRLPSTANLMVSSKDRSSGTSSKFVISKNNNILSGFFTRFAMVEMILDYCIDNIQAATGTNSIVFQIGTGPFLVATLDDGGYTTQDCLDALVDEMNAAQVGTTFTVVQIRDGLCEIQGTSAFKFINIGNLVDQLNLQTDVLATEFEVSCPNLIPYQYLDFACSSLTYQQELKDGTTAAVNRDVIYRWIFGWDGPSPVDGYGYPIFQGMTKFKTRRYLSFPKQIKWDARQSLGQLVFEVFTDTGANLRSDTVFGNEMEFYMTLLVSEQ